MSPQVCPLEKRFIVCAGLVYDWLVGPRAPLGVPTRKPLLNLRGTSFNERMRPEPVVFLLLAFSPQLTVIACQMSVLHVGILRCEGRVHIVKGCRRFVERVFFS